MTHYDWPNHTTPVTTTTTNGITTYSSNMLPPVSLTYDIYSQPGNIYNYYPSNMPSTVTITSNFITFPEEINNLFKMINIQNRTKIIELSENFKFSHTYYEAYAKASIILEEDGMLSFYLNKVDEELKMYSVFLNLPRKGLHFIKAAMLGLLAKFSLEEKYVYELCLPMTILMVSAPQK